MKWLFKVANLLVMVVRRLRIDHEVMTDVFLRRNHYDGCVQAEKREGGREGEREKEREFIVNIS